MTIAIKGGTVVTADLTYRADVLIDGGIIAAVGPDLSGDETIDASGAFIMPGGIDPHTHLEMPFMGTHSADDFDSGTAAALAGGDGDFHGSFAVPDGLPLGEFGRVDVSAERWDGNPGHSSVSLLRGDVS